MDKSELFVIPIFKHNISINQNLCENIFKQLEWNPKNPFITQSKNLLNEQFKHLKNDIDPFVRYAMNEMGFDDVDYEIFRSWGTRTAESRMSLFHRHANSFMSGVIYFSDNTSPILFQNPFSLSYSHKNSTYTSSGSKVSPKCGDVIIFPSSIVHFITPNESESDRYSLAFNIVPTGNYGVSDGQIDIVVNKEF